ncbi:hypothetical protein EAE96_008334 [Botrytis aclada]|nr:hypothetical protein EAE96_008334 [Botrytis aclada]
MKIVKRINESIKKIASGRLVDGTSTAESDIEVSRSTEPPTSHEHVLSLRPNRSPNAVSDDLLHAPSSNEQEDGSCATVNSGTSPLSPPSDLNHDNLSDDTDDDYCIDSLFESGFDRLRQSYVESRSSGLPSIQEEDEGEIHDLDEELEASMAGCSLDTDERQYNELQSNHNLEDRLEPIEQSCNPLAPSINRRSDKDLSGHPGKSSATDLVRRLVEVNILRERPLRRLKRLLESLYRIGGNGSFKDRISKAFRNFLGEQK